MDSNDWARRNREMGLPEEYSRSSNTERFLALHDHALALLDRLIDTFEVVRTETFAMLPNMTPFQHAREPVTLTPAHPDAASIAIAFTTFPSLIVRFGRWTATPFPDCGCDACGATAQGEIERLEGLVGDVVAGHFREQIQIPFFGQAWVRWSFGDVVSVGHLSGGGQSLTRDQARKLAGNDTRHVEWRPWTHRGRR